MGQPPLSLFLYNGGDRYRLDTVRSVTACRGVGGLVKPDNKFICQKQCNQGQLRSQDR